MYKFVFSDFDGTLTEDGKLNSTFFDLLELIEQKNSKLIIVSGRSLSWGHFLLTHFPLNECIMEGGGVILKKKDYSNIDEISLLSDDQLEHLQNITCKLLKKFSDCSLTYDSFGRKTDRALDLSALSVERKKEIEDFLNSEKIYHSSSSIHLNFTTANITKALAVKKFIEDQNISLDDCIYFGDALNDEPCFELFKNSVGVSNLSKKVTKLPKVVLEGPSNVGIFGVYHYIKTL